MVWKRYVNRTEAWAREVEDDTEEIVGSTGRAVAYRGDMIVNQNLRGQTFTYILTRDDFAENWRDPSDVDTDTTESEYGDPSELGGATVDEESTDGENSVDNRTETAGRVATVGTAAETPAPTGGDEEPTPASEDTAGQEDPDAAPPAPTASAPTSAASGDAATPAGNPPTVPEPRGNETPAVSPVSGTATPVEPVEAPQGSGASETTLTDPATVETAQEDAQPATTTPAATVDPSSDPGGTGTRTAEEQAGQVTSTDEQGGGDEGAAPTPTEGVSDAPAEPTTNTEPTPETGGAKSDAAPEESSSDTPEGAVRNLSGARRKAKDNPQA